MYRRQKRGQKFVREAYYLMAYAYGNSQAIEGPQFSSKDSLTNYLNSVTK